MMACFARLLRKWQSTTLHSSNTYSVERFYACHQYTQTASSFRVLLVCVLSILPPLALIVLLDSLPLEDPSKGWSANWVLWIRQYISTFTLSAGVSLELYVTAPTAALTAKKCVLIALVSSTVYTGCVMLIAKYIAFPIPFEFITTTLIWEVPFVVCVVVAIGRRKLNDDPVACKQIDRFVRMMLARLPLALFYASYNALFTHLKGLQQMSAVLLLPVAKFSLKYLLTRAAIDLDDYIPTLRISIDIFDAIYLSKCMQSAGSILTTSAIMIIDTVQNAYHIRHFQVLLEETRELQTQSGITLDHSDLMSAIIEICKQPELLLSGELERLRLRSCNVSGRSLPQQNQALIEQLSNRQIQIKNTTRRSRLSFLNSYKTFPVNVFIPVSTIQLKRVGKSPAPTLRLLRTPSEARTKLLKKALDLFSMSETILLVEYIECAIPILYSIYLPILFYLPNGKYYPEIALLTPKSLQATISKVLIYASLEFASLIWVHWMFKRRFKVSALHQLAFALEDGQLIIQASFLAWTIVIFQFTLQHLGKLGMTQSILIISRIDYHVLFVLGVDFTFQFKWLKKSN